MKRVEIIKVEVEIVESKLLAFLAISGDSWVYAYKGGEMLSLLLWIAFTVNAFGVFINLTKLGKLQNSLKG